MSATRSGHKHINLNVTQETVTLDVADLDHVVVNLIPDAATFTTYVAAVMYKVDPGDFWTAFSTPVALTQAAPSSGRLDVRGIKYIGVRVTTNQGAAAYGSIYFSGGIDR